MIKQYLIERLSWIIFFMILQLFIIFMGVIDASIPISSLLYIVFLSMLGFIIFLVIRYNKETKFYRSLNEWDSTHELNNISSAESPFEKLTEKRINQQTEHYKDELDQQLTNLEQEKDELLSWIHEVKTPLTTMQLMIDRVEQETLRSQLQYEWLRIHLLVDRQLHQKRMPFIHNDIYIEKTIMDPLINQEIKALKSWCFQKGIGFDVSLEVSEVLTDAKWLAFLIRQLLTNAVKYSESSDIIIKSYQKNDQTYLEIRDYGRGIEPKDMTRIFDKGFTSTANHKDNASTGMGLYLAQKVSASLKIKITVQSTVGEGSVFTLSFPKKNEFVQITGM
ncbi:sensor histidine kinase [Ornithinibacillus sp. L9]|uniref:histidine kinase n=1 Tax=Ornithinibacillus caprae TaxID=2678566 RepID=A0A6N8FLR8_9BACI|nr:sensor histidine kinase [Ornithinibacillus caprae]MUK88258.1 sensor histidine kinase [Ornithinibacillus caprae]